MVVFAKIRHIDSSLPLWFYIAAYALGLTIYVLYRMWEADSKEGNLDSVHSAEETDEIIKRFLSGREWKERFIKVAVDWKNGRF